MRMIKAYKAKGKLMKIINDALRLGRGFERFIVSIVTILFMCHVISCFWYFLSQLEDTPNSWIEHYGLTEASNFQKYIVGYYWTMATIVTVGYGDIVPQTFAEKIFAIIWMLIGVFVYTFTIGSLSSFLSRLDLKNAEYREKMNILVLMKKEHKIDNTLFKKIKQHLKYGSK